MDLYSGLPYWIAKNKLYDYRHPLDKDHKTDVLIIGSGITGALVAHELSAAGIECTLIDKRGLARGSSIASTALLQYEIDKPLYKMSEEIGEEQAVKAYKSCLQSIKDIKQVFSDINYNAGYENVPSVFYASDEKGVSIIEKEYEIRKKHGLPVRLLDRQMLSEKYGIQAGAALENDESAQMDAYAGAIHLIDYHMKEHKLHVFTHSEIVELEEQTSGIRLKTDKGHIIESKYVVVAAGFEAGTFLPKKVMELTSTYAIISEPVDESDLWYKHSLIWETNEPYIYIRTDNNRIIVGGEDEEFNDPALRDSMLREKAETLENKFKELFPSIPFKTDMTWCGTFSSTKDGLPYIGCWPGQDRLFYALGYGGNGITFSMVAAQIIKNKIKGIADDRESVFGFSRKHK